MNNTVFKELRNQGVFREELKTILYSTQFCGLCLESNNNMYMLNEYFEIIVNGLTVNKTLNDITEVVFGNTDNILTKTEICSKCTQKLVQSYTFIQNAVEMSKIIMNFIQDMYCKASDIHNHLNESTIESSNVVIVLENNNISLAKDKENSILKKESEIKKEEIELKTECSIFKCAKCSIRLPSYKEWNQHKLKHHKVFKCKICFKTFKCVEFLNAHYKTHSKGKYKLCNKLVSNTELLRHLKVKHKDSMHSSSMNASKKFCQSVEKTTTDSQCVMCLKAFKDNDKKLHNCKFKCLECNIMPCIHYKYLISYREQIWNNIAQIKCSDCDYVCKTKEVLLGHVNKKHLDHHPYTCDECGQQFYSKAILRAHINRLHEGNCENCNQEYRNINEYKEHIESCGFIKRDLHCDECTASFNIVEDLVKHIRNRHSNDVFPCGLCNKKFSNDSKRKEHMVNKHSGHNRNRVKDFECVICQDKFNSKSDQVQHMKTHGPNISYPCRICNKEFGTLRQYKAHNRKHIGPYATCHVCGQEMRQILLKKHLTTHTDPVVTCETCGKSFKSTSLLKYHQKLHLESVPCPKCNKLINPSRLRRHWKSHLIDENPELKSATKQKPNLKCEQCDYRTWNNILLECHMNRHHLKIKPYVCHVCSKNFIGKHLLKKHLETHTIDKSVICMVCLKSFANSACLKMHLRLHTGERPFTCELCGERFRSSSIMNVHKLKKHSSKSYACPLCSNKFHTVRDLRRHVIKVHWKQKNKRFDPRELKGLDKQHYHLFHDGRRVKVAEEDVDIYMPCDRPSF